MSAQSGASATRSIKSMFRNSYNRRLVLRFVLRSTVEIGGILLLYVTAEWFAGRYTWYYGRVYRILKEIQNLSVIWIPLLSVTLLIINMFRTLREPLSYLDQVVEEAKKLAEPTGEKIRLPDDLESVEYHMNEIREEALENRRKAEEAEQRKNDLIVYLAHDLKTPLTSVIGYLSLLQEEKDLPETQREKFTGVALDKAYRLEDLINEFFDITRFNLTNIVLEKTQLDLSRMVEQTVFEFQPSLAAKHLTIEQDCEEGVRILADSDKLERVLDNLLRNAISYSTPDTAIRITLRKNGSEAVFTVTNHGRTIPKEKLDRMFEQFFRLDSARSTGTGGAGLGLAIAREIVELHDGSIRAESAEETITFTVTLPAGQSSENRKN